VIDLRIECEPKVDKQNESIINVKN
jgi:hypothetical protein